MADDNTNQTQQASAEIEPLSDESLEDVAGGEWCSIILCSGQSPAPKQATP